MSAFRNLKSLHLGGNHFTTAARVRIWEATSSFLTQSPFPLDEDLNYTSAYLKSLDPTIPSLDLSGLIPNDPTTLHIMLPQVIDLFPNLTALDLSNNNILYVNGNNTSIIGGIQALTKYLPHLTTLHSLRMSNAAGNMGLDIPPEVRNFSQIIGQLPNLHTLDFSWNMFLIANFLGKGLENSHSLTSINLSGCWDGNSESDTWQGGLQLIQGLQAQLHLSHLDLSYNLIGATFSDNKDPNSTLALANALNSWTQLRSLNLAGCSIGYEDQGSATTFLEQLGELATTVHKQGRTLEVDLLNNNIEKITWTKNAKLLATLTEHSIKDACAAQVCTGEPISKPTKSKTHEADVQRELGAFLNDASEAIRSHQVPWYSPARLWEALKGFWGQDSEQDLDLTNPHARELVSLRARCGDLKNAADVRYDKWYGFSLEDLAESVTEKLERPETIDETTVLKFEKRLRRIKRDFRPRRAQQPQQIFATGLESSTFLLPQERFFELLLIPSTPVLGSGTPPLALGY